MEWVFYLRYNYKKNFNGIITPERVAKLEELGFIWDSIAYEWSNLFRALEDFKKQYGHCRAKKGTRLGNWLDRQRQAFKKGKLSLERFTLPVTEGTPGESLSF